MKRFSRASIFLFIFVMLAVSACGAAAPSELPAAGGKVDMAPVQFTGVIESMDGNQWVVNGQAITVDPSVVNDGPFNVGDTVKVEVDVQQDGSLVVTQVETPDPVVAAPLASPTIAVTDEPVNLTETPTPNSPHPAPAVASGNVVPTSTVSVVLGGNVSNEISGTVDSVNGNIIVIAGQTFQIADNVASKSQIIPGDFVRARYTLNADGSMSITEIEILNAAGFGNNNYSGENEHESEHEGGDD